MTVWLAYLAAHCMILSSALSGTVVPHVFRISRLSLMNRLLSLKEVRLTDFVFAFVFAVSLFLRGHHDYYWEMEPKTVFTTSETWARLRPSCHWLWFETYLTNFGRVSDFFDFLFVFAVCLFFTNYELNGTQADYWEIKTKTISTTSVTCARLPHSWHWLSFETCLTDFARKSDIFIFFACFAVSLFFTNYGVMRELPITEK